jgi:putative ABC transport system substrate-binding protein
MSLLMKRREFTTLLGGAAAAWPRGARTQQRTLPVIGFVDASPEQGPILMSFRQGLAEAGIVVGRDTAIEHRQIISGRSKELVLDLVERRVAVIVAAGGSAVAAMQAKAATSTIPIVFAMGANPVKTGLVPSLSRPDANVTGVTFLASELAGKRLDLLRKLVPQTMKVGYLSVVGVSVASVEEQEDVLAAAQALAQEVTTILCNNVTDLQNAFATMAQTGVGAVLVRAAPFLLANRVRIVNLAARYKLPTIYPSAVYAQSGGLISYSADVLAGFRLAGSQYVARILKGAKPADLPVQQPTKFELIINLKTARTLGIDVPPTLLALADEVIE